MAKTVLIVEDERAIVEILKFNLKREGYETLEALDGQTGLQQSLHPYLAVRSLRGVFPRPGCPGALHVGGRKIEALRSGKLVLPDRSGRTPGMDIFQFRVGKCIARTGFYLVGTGRSRRALQPGTMPLHRLQEVGLPDGLCRTAEREHPRENQQKKVSCPHIVLFFRLIRV